MEEVIALSLSAVMGKPLWLWVTFAFIILLLLLFDLGLFNRKDHEIGVAESLKLSAFYISISIMFGGFVWFTLGEVAAVQYYTGYFIEKSLSMDNVFVISMIFGYFAVPRIYQHRVLFWGILGVIILRALMIGVGVALVEQFHWVLYIFGGFLLLSGVKMLVIRETAPDIAANPMLQALRRVLPVSDRFYGGHFFVRLPKPDDSGRATLYATPLFLALLTIETADLIFAVDSVPAIFAVTTDPYIIYTSNIFAILGLRALYFALAAMANRFTYLKYALALVLVFIGGKIFWAQAFGKVDPLLSLTVTFFLLAAGVWISLIKTRTAGPSS